MSAYATLQNLDGGLQIQLDENVNNNVDIRFDVSVWSGPDSAYLSTEEIVLNVKNRILLSGLISEDYVMEEGKEYLIVDNVAMGTGTLLTIEPGVRVYFSDNKSMICNGSLVAMGTPESRIVFQPENVHWGFVQVEEILPFSTIAISSLERTSALVMRIIILKIVSGMISMASHMALLESKPQTSLSVSSLVLAAYYWTATD